MVHKILCETDKNNSPILRQLKKKKKVYLIQYFSYFAFFRRVPSGCRSPSAAGARKKTRSAYTGRDKRGAESMPCVNVFAPSSADTHANPRSLINRATRQLKTLFSRARPKLFAKIMIRLLDIFFQSTRRIYLSRLIKNR